MKKFKKEHMPRILVWDIPTRLFHWLLAVLVVISFLTAKISAGLMPYHELSGFSILALLLFRLGWGFFGGRHSRFVSFVSGPGEAVRYAFCVLKKNTSKYVGHNPLGGWSILAMMGSLLIQAGTGLFANDDIFTQGPLYHWVDKTTSDRITTIHQLNQTIIAVLIVVHVLAVLFYLFVKRDNLISPMITGLKEWNGDAQPSDEKPWAALIMAGTAALLVYLLVK